MTYKYTEKDRLEGYLRDFKRLSFLLEQIMYEVPQKGSVFRNIKNAIVIVSRLCDQTNNAIETIKNHEHTNKGAIINNLYVTEWPKKEINQ